MVSAKLHYASYLFSYPPLPLIQIAEKQPFSYREPSNEDTKNGWLAKNGWLPQNKSVENIKQASSIVT